MQDNFIGHKHPPAGYILQAVIVTYQTEWLFPLHAEQKKGDSNILVITIVLVKSLFFPIHLIVHMMRMIHSATLEGHESVSIFCEAGSRNTMRNIEKPVLQNNVGN